MKNYKLIFLFLCIGISYEKPKVNIFLTTYNGSLRVNALAWDGPYGDLGIEYLKENYAPWIDFSLDYVLQDDKRAAITRGSLEDDIEDLMTRHYYKNIKTVDAFAHIYTGLCQSAFF